MSLAQPSVVASAIGRLASAGWVRRQSPLTAFKIAGTGIGGSVVGNTRWQSSVAGGNQFSFSAATVPKQAVRHRSLFSTTLSSSHRFQPSPSAIKDTQIRFCSYRRNNNNMCRSHGSVEGGSTNVHVRELLPTHVVPRHYDVTIEPDFTKFSFDGTVIIDLDVAEESNSISLHTLEIDIHSVKISCDGKLVSDSPKINYTEKTQVSKFDFDGTLTKGSKAQIEIAFTGDLNDKMAGFYRSTFTRDDGTQGILGCTQFEATDARRGFPCFDEPALKATFAITLIADEKLTCLSNMDVASETKKGDKSVVKFNTSPIMSTYLVAYVIGELNCIETNEFRVPVRVFAPPGVTIEHGQFSLQLAAKTLAFYEKIFGIDFPLPKMDQVAIPDFAQGAMENWGLVTYRVVDLMLDEKNTSATYKTRVAEVVQHELAHQWFGNLVTMDWWDGLWLNEGFATWVSWYSCNIFYPEWKVWETYVIDNLQSALMLDSLRSSHPIEVPIRYADEVNEIFDAISYSKGSCILRMLSSYLGEDKFLEGVRHYLKKHAYKNTDTSDLWASLSQVSGKPVVEVMDAWTKKIGHPVVTVTESDKTVKFQQNRFLRTGDVKPEEDETLYPIFLALRSKDGVDNVVALNDRSIELPLPADDFFKINANHTGLFRTSYSPERLDKLGKAAKDGLLSVEDRAGMVSDAAALAVPGYQKTSGVLNLIKGLNTESQYIVWNEILSTLGSIKSAFMFEDESVRNALNKFQLELVSAKTHELGWQFAEGDSHVDQQFKPLMFGAAGIAGDEKVVAAAKDMFAKYVAGDKSAIHPNLRSSVYAIVLKFGGETEYNQLWEHHNATKDGTERQIVLRALGRASQPELIQRTLEAPMTGKIKDQDIHSLLGGLVAHPGGVSALIEFITNNFDTLVARFPPTLPPLGNIVTIAIVGISRKEDLDRIKDFFKDKDQTGFVNSLKQALDTVDSKISWLNRDKEDVTGWLKSNEYLS